MISVKSVPKINYFGKHKNTLPLAKNQKHNRSQVDLKLDNTMILPHIFSNKYTSKFNLTPAMQDQNDVLDNILKKQIDVKKPELNYFDPRMTQ